MLASGATAGDLVETISFFVSSVLNAIPAVANAVTETYINDGAVTKAKMAANGAWAPAGTVIQVVNATTNVQVGSSSSTFADTGLTASITPTSSSSKILVLAHQSGLYKSGGTDRIMEIRLVTGSSTVLAAMEKEYGNGVTTFGGGSDSISFLHSPATTSSVTYKTQFSSSQNNATVYVQISNAVSSITLMEISA